MKLLVWRQQEPSGGRAQRDPAHREAEFALECDAGQLPTASIDFHHRSIASVRRDKTATFPSDS